MLKNVISSFKNRYKLIPLGDKKIITLQKINSIKRRKRFLCMLFFCLFTLLFPSIYLVKNKKKEKNATSILVKSNRTIYEELNDCQKFVNKAVNHILINPNELFYRAEEPKISIVFPMYIVKRRNKSPRVLKKLRELLLYSLNFKN